VYTEESACRAAIAAQCERREACLGESSDCRPTADLCPEYYFNANSNRTVDDVAACIEAMRAMPCMDVALYALPSCLKNGRLDAGKSCAVASECKSGECAHSDPSSCGTCSEIVALGGPCVASAQCPAGAFCHKQTHTCAANETIVHGGAGAKCDPAADPVLGCEGDLACVADAGGNGGVCATLPGDGQPCARPILGLVSCAPGLVCHADDTCGPPQRCGEVTCEADSYCREGGPSPTCVRFATDGEKCGNLPEDSRCIAGTQCVASDTADGGKVCAKLAASSIGEPCDPAHPCRYPLVCRDDPQAPDGSTSAKRCAVLTTEECSGP
jgi:hypothetical protein